MAPLCCSPVAARIIDIYWNLIEAVRPAFEASFSLSAQPTTKRRELLHRLTSTLANNP